MYEVDLCNLGSDQLLFYLEFIHRIQNNAAQFRRYIMHFIRCKMKIIYFSYITLLKEYFVTNRTIIKFDPAKYIISIPTLNNHILSSLSEQVTNCVFQNDEIVRGTEEKIDLEFDFNKSFFSIRGYALARFSEIELSN